MGRTSSRSAAAESRTNADGPADAITKAYYELTGGQDNVRVHLHELRDKVPHLSRAEFDRTMLRMDSANKASLYDLNDMLERNPTRNAGALYTPSGNIRHIVYIGPSA